MGLLGDFALGAIAGGAGEYLRQGQLQEADAREDKRFQREQEAKKDLAKFSADLGWQYDEQRMDKQAGIQADTDQRQSNLRMTEQNNQNQFVAGESAKERDARLQTTKMNNATTLASAKISTGPSYANLAFQKQVYGDGQTTRNFNDMVTQSRMLASGVIPTVDEKGKPALTQLPPDSMKRVNQYLGGDPSVQLSQDEKKVAAGQMAASRLIPQQQDKDPIKTATVQRLQELKSIATQKAQQVAQIQAMLNDPKLDDSQKKSVQRNLESAKRSLIETSSIYDGLLAKSSGTITNAYKSSTDNIE